MTKLSIGASIILETALAFSLCVTAAIAEPVSRSQPKSSPRAKPKMQAPPAKRPALTKSASTSQRRYPGIFVGSYGANPGGWSIAMQLYSASDAKRKGSDGLIEYFNPKERKHCYYNLFAIPGVGGYGLSYSAQHYSGGLDCRFERRLGFSVGNSPKNSSSLITIYWMRDLSAILFSRKASVQDLNVYIEQHGRTSIDQSGLTLLGSRVNDVAVTASSPSDDVKIAPALSKDEQAFQISPITGEPIPPAPTESEYAAGYKAHSSGRPGAGVEPLDEFIASNPASAIKAEAQFWLGRSYLKLSKPASAAKAFFESVKGDPKGQYAPLATLNLGDAMYSLGKPQLACVTWNEIEAVFMAEKFASIRAVAADRRKRFACPSLDATAQPTAANEPTAE